ncbi:MAG: peptidylprolyl isomerase [Bacteroidetes Order II. Incertae sedis bacterium]|nr:peptidylprolyl isomerase [Bacteroidetes Order II. bacterium]
MWMHHLSGNPLFWALVVATLLVIPACQKHQASTEAIEKQSPASKNPLPTLSDTTATDPHHYAEITTPLGKMVVRLYEETPKHRDNFIKLATSGFYDGLFFHRVMSGLMIQGGDPNSKNNNPADDGLGGPGYVIDSEILPYSFHKRGEVCALQSAEVPGKSSGSQFYIVQGGEPIPKMILDDQEAQVRELTGLKEFRFSQEARRHYSRAGGAPWLDLQFSCFGEVVSGLSTIDRLAQLETPRTLGEAGSEPALLDRPRQIQKARMAVKMLAEFPKDGIKVH